MLSLKRYNNFMFILKLLNQAAQRYNHEMSQTKIGSKAKDKDKEQTEIQV